MIAVTPWTQCSFFYFLGLCLLTTSRNNGWIDIHEIFRIWKQGAIGYTVSWMNRLFHALQTRRGGGLLTRIASCSLGPHYYSVIISCMSTICVKIQWYDYCIINKGAVYNEGVVHPLWYNVFSYSRITLFGIMYSVIAGSPSLVLCIQL